jgi:hypothetical protein
MSTCVYQYGLGRPFEHSDLVLDQMRVAHQYRRELARLERGRREMYRAVLAKHEPFAAALASATAAGEVVCSALEALKAARIETGERNPDQALTDAVTSARAAERVALTEFRTATKRAEEAMAAELAAVNERAHGIRLELRAECGVYWGTYLLVEQADDAARKTPLYEGAAPRDPARVHEWTGGGKIAVQLQNGLPVSKVFQPNTRVMLARPDERAYVRTNAAQAPGRGRRSLARSTLRMCVQTQDRKPIFGAWPALLHRELPPAGVIKWAAVKCDRVGPRDVWRLLLTVDTTDVKRPPRAQGSGLCVGVDIGWRQLEAAEPVDGYPHDVRIGYWYGQDGRHGEVRVPALLVACLRRAERFKADRDQTFNEARAALLGRLEGLEVPPWFAEAIETLPKWRSPGRLSAFVGRVWRERRWPGDEQAFAAAENWWYADRWIWRREASQRRRALHQRDKLFEQVAAELSRAYETVVLEDDDGTDVPAMDLREFARRQPPEAPEAENEVARSNRQLVATGDFRIKVMNAFKRTGAVSLRPVAGTTQNCHACGAEQAFDAANVLVHTCTVCGETWDQDENAARNLVREHLSGAPEPGTTRKRKKASEDVRKGESRFKRAARRRLERQQEQEALATPRRKWRKAS